MEGELLFGELTHRVIGAAMEVHRVLGGGFLEFVYEEALSYELEVLGVPFERQKDLDIRYKDLIIPRKYRADLVVEDKILIENKSAGAITSVDEAQLIHYLRATGFHVGLILNFGKSSLEWKGRIL